MFIYYLKMFFVSLGTCDFFLVLFLALAMLDATTYVPDGLCCLALAILRAVLSCCVLHSPCCLVLTMLCAVVFAGPYCLVLAVLCAAVLVL